MSPTIRPLAGPLALLAVLATAGRAPASSPGAPPVARAAAVGGIVSDSSGTGIAGANISVAGVAGHAISDANGAFRLSASVEPGLYRVVTRRIGFRPDTLMVTVPTEGDVDLRIRLVAAPQRIAPVVIAAARARYSGRMRGFYERRDRGGGGRFFTAEDIAKQRPRAVSDLIRTLPGTRISSVGGQNVITFRGMRCPPLIWIDGSPATAGYLDPDVFAVTTLAGIEVYSGPATVPAELMWVRGKSSCGAIALWTKMPEPRRRGTTQISAEDLAALVDAQRLHTADDVDTPAAPDSAYLASPMYPDSLLRAAIGGRVIVEFVVDIAGMPDMTTFGAVLSTHPPFTEAVRVAVGSARFTPAWLGGRRVRQLVQLSFRFEPPGTPRAGPDVDLGSPRGESGDTTAGDARQ